MSAVAAMMALLKSFGMRHDSFTVKCRLCRLATGLVRRERAAVRRARGKVRGYVALNGGKYLIADETGSAPVPWKTEAEARHNTTTSNEVARVVAVPKRRKGGRK